MRYCLQSIALAATLLATAAHPQDRAAVCARGEGVFYGSPITLEQVFVIPGQTEPAVPSGDDLFPDPATDTAYAGPTCEGGGLVGAIDCVAETIEASGTSTTETAVSAVEAEARAAVAGSAEAGDGTLTTASGAKAEPRVVRQLLVLKPVLIPGAPGRVSYVPDGPGGLEVPEDLTEAEIAAVSPMVSARNAALLSYQGELSLETQDDLIRGMPVPIPTPPLPDGVSLAGDPGILAMGAECGALFRAMTETARLLQLRAEKVARIAQLKEMLKAERDKAGLLGIFWDSEQADRLERIIAFEEDNLRKIDARLGEHKATIDRRERWLENEDRARELEAIKADPDRLAAETQRRRDVIVEAAQEAAKARWLLIEGEAAYARQLAAHDAMIKAARENGQDDLADKLEEDKTRLEAARDSWREHAQSMIDVRTREQARLMQENAADGIGPVGDATSILLAEGKNPVEVIESGARERARASAERRALTDSATLGGSATEQYDLVDFGQDLFETNLEMQTNPALFYRRFGSYLGGAAEAAYDGVVDLAVIGVEAGDLAGEAFESGLSDVTGYEFNAFGRENLDTLVSAGTALSEADALKLGELAGRAAEAADRRVSQMAASGEAGIRDALATTGYVAASVLGAEEIAMAGSVRIASAVRDAARGAEALADVSKLAEGVTDASRLADAAKLDAPTIPDAPVTTKADELSDTVKVDPEDLTDTVKLDPPSLDAPATPDAPDPVKTGPVDSPSPDVPTTPDPEDLAETVKIDPPKPDAPVTPDPLDPDKTTPVDPPAPDTPATPDPEDLTETVRIDPPKPDAPDPDDLTKTIITDPPSPDAPSTPDVSDASRTDIGAPDPALLRPVKRADGPSIVDDAVDAAAGKPATAETLPSARAVPPTPKAQIGRLGEVIDASPLTPDKKAFFKKLATGRTPEEAAARAIIDGGLNPSDILSSGVLSKDDLRRGMLGYLDEHSGLTPEAARLFADRAVGGVRDTLTKLGVDNSVIKVFEAKLGKFSPEHALASGAWNQGVSPLRLIDEAGVAEADIRRGLDEYLQLERGIEDPRKRARLVEDYMRPVTDRAAADAAGVPSAARIPEGAPTARVTAKTLDGRKVPLVMEAEPFKAGSYNEIYRLGPPFEGKVARRSKTSGDTPEAKIDEFGRTALADPAVSPGIIRPQDRTLLIGPDGRKLEILPFEGRTAESQILDNPGGVPTPGQTVAVDQAMRELNKAGYAWLDNHIGNYLFEPVPGIADEWRILVLDPGGIVKVADGSAETARDIQLQLARLDQQFLGNVAKNRAAGYSIAETRDALANAHIARSEGLKEELLPQLDTAFGGTDDLASGLQFRVDGLAYFPASRSLIEVEDEGLEAAYNALRVAAE
jgi:hypothetical protein